MKEERSGILWKQREAFLRANKNNNEYNNNNDYVLAGEEYYKPDVRMSFWRQLFSIDLKGSIMGRIDTCRYFGKHYREYFA